MPKKKKERGFSFPVTSLAGSSLPNFIRLRKDYTIDRRFMGRFLASIAVTAIFEPFRLYENLRWGRRIKQTARPHKPVFIIGFWRSGTTMLHELLCLAPGTSYVTTFQTIFPHLILSHGWWLKPLANLIMPSRRPFDRVDMDLEYPQEEEIAMANIQALSFYNFLYFPKNYENFWHRDLYFEQASVQQIDRWKKEYRKLIAKALINRPGKQFVSKNPSNMARIKVLLEMYPDARFIFIYRNPYKVLESVYGFFREVVPAVQLQLEGGEVSRDVMARFYADMIRHYDHVRELVPDGHLVELKYEDLLADPSEEIRKIYDTLGLEGFESLQPNIEAYIRNSADRTKNHFNISMDTIALVNQYLIDLVKRWNYEVKD